MRRRVRSLPLFWRVFVDERGVLVLAFAGLVFAPVTVSVPVGGERAARARGRPGRAAGVNLVAAAPRVPPARRAGRDDAPARSAGSRRARAESTGDPDVAALAQTFNEMLDRLESERRESARQALMVQEGERQRIARELHDEVGQTLTGRDAAGRRARRDASPTSCANSSTSCARPPAHGTEEVRRIARRLRPEALEDLGLQSALAALATAFGEQAQIAVERRLEPGLPLSQEEELVVYRVAQEALTNVARHADATAVELRAAPERSDGIVLTVRDDGRGLPPERCRVLTRHPRHARARDARSAPSSSIASRPGRRHRGPTRPSPRPGSRHDDPAEDAAS